MSEQTTKNTDFLSLVEDPSFAQSVLEAENADVLLKELQQQNPERSLVYQYAVEFIRFNRSNKTKMNAYDYREILSNIEHYSKKQSSFRLLTLSPFKLQVAAMIMVLISVGSLIFYRHLTNDPLTEFAKNSVGKDNHGLILLSDGSSKVLKNNESLIDYSSTQGEVVIKNTAEEERVENHKEIEDDVLNQVVVPYGQRHKVLLSDGTLVQLNAGSRLTFPAIFSGHTREVYLKGEGYFEVHKNAQMPFVVKTDFVNINVTGTSFNVSAYEDENTITTVLVEGKVNVSQKNRLFSNDTYSLVPGQGCFYSVPDKKSIVKGVDVSEYILWKDGLYDFKDKPLRDVVMRVNRYFNKEIVIENEVLANTQVSGKLVLSEDLTEVMQYLSKTVEGRYEINEKGGYVLRQ